MLAGNRDIGLLAKMRLTDELSLWGGMFNGTSHDFENNDNTFYYTSRLIWNQPVGEEGELQVGANIGHSTEDGTSISNGQLPDIGGNRTIWGTDFRFTDSRFLLAGEYLYGDLQYNFDLGGAEDDTVSGFYLTAGYNIVENLQLLARFDHIQSDLFALDENLIILGSTYTLSQAASFSLNYRLNPDDSAFSNHAVLLQTQLAF